MNSTQAGLFLILLVFIMFCLIRVELISKFSEKWNETIPEYIHEKFLMERSNSETLNGLYIMERSNRISKKEEFALYFKIWKVNCKSFIKNKPNGNDIYNYILQESI